MARPTAHRHHPSRRLALALVASAGLAAAAPAGAQAATNPFNCDASALRGVVLGTASLEPASANRGQASCQNATGGLTGVLPAPLAASAVVARTISGGPADRPDLRTALAIGGLADVKIGALGLPLQLPVDTVLDSVQPLLVPLNGLLAPVASLLGVPNLSLDLRPALAQLLPDGGLPDSIVSADAVLAYAGARCTDGKAVPFSTSSVTGLKVLGQPVVVDSALQDTLNLIDTASIDPSRLDPLALLPTATLDTLTGTPLVSGLVNTALRPLIQSLLDALPNIEVPATVANVKITAGGRSAEDGVLTQQALRVQISVLNQAIADVTIGEARVNTAGADCTPPAPAVTPPTTTDLALQCTTRRLVLEDVIARGDRVSLIGAADRALAGKTVSIRFLATGRTVARVRIAPDGSFRATAPLPSRSVRSGNRARYQAVVGREKSLDLKLERRMVVSGVSVRDGKVTIAGRVTRPLARPAATITVTRRVSCKKMAVVARVKPRSDGSFRVTVPAPEGQLAAVYRLGTRVRKTAGNAKTFPTFTLPRAVDLS
ncbi:hypothetical protein [Paraconexibacter algicola]|uniref:Choice-of-anchor G family protein n=1 Tax=Paraconexibacter algicola TaxID=2133960 RepID=A0A2T4UHM8_9ACTN|nr:hypothetical protein [Paraconexibacter algicola]PTL58728.1 hypothetical protein C7Y72_03230 [Paraconexibacter algicola]